MTASRTEGTVPSWAAHEVHTAALGDPRRGRRLVTLVEALAAQPAASVPRACGSWAATNGAYRLWNHPHLTADALRAAPIDATRQRLRALPCVR
ncbi:MAG: transposase, partial [Roseiflexaceae bacterium]|nr:transposase [Roseiflexaceae bacterium]